MASRNASFHDGVWVAILWSPFKNALALALVSVSVLALAWCIDELLVFKVWPQGVEHLRYTLQEDLKSGISLASRQGGNAAEITDPANALYGFIFEASGVHDMGRQFANSAPLSIPDTVVRRAYVEHREAVEVAMLGTQLLGVRSATLARFVPLLCLLYMMGCVDGLSERSIRRASGGCESANLYHRAKYFQVCVLGLGGILILCWPRPIEWVSSTGAGIIIVASLARLQWMYYKKHI